MKQETKTKVNELMQSAAILLFIAYVLYLTASYRPYMVNATVEVTYIYGGKAVKHYAFLIEEKPEKNPYVLDNGCLVFDPAFRHNALECGVQSVKFTHYSYHKQE